MYPAPRILISVNKFCQIILYLLIVSFALPAKSEGVNTDSLLNELEQTILKRDYYYQQKLNRIFQLKQSLQNEANQESRYHLYFQLQEQYESFNYDSAFHYTLQLYRLSRAMGRPDRIAISKIKLGFVLLSSGLFKEAIDTLQTIDIQTLKSEQLGQYYATLARAYYDLADYNKDGYYSEYYLQVGNRYQAKACELSNKNSSDYWMYEGLKQMKMRQYEQAKRVFRYAIQRFSLDEHAFAIAASSLAYVHLQLKETENAMEMLIKAAIADIKSSTKETVALRNLSQLLYEKGDVKTAYRYIKIALDDASYYNARHRKIEIASILPIIEGEKLNTVERQKRIITGYAIAVSILSLIALTFLIIIFTQMKRLRRAQQQIQQAYQSLTQINSKLQEANKIKDEYIGYYFNVTSEYIDKLEKFQKDVHRKLVAGKVEELKNMLSNVDLKKEKEELYRNFDMVFLKLFPDFVVEFNKLLKEEHRIVLKENELLNTDLRIFALIRMGISDNEKIANILQYSVNTIYTYKTKIKNRSLVPNEKFEEYVMKINSV
ncbi:MAG: DUF6377 domain-containing protein [Bacteroidales bacterium]|nr:DUF6377 domain-containing protein [Bacteroidales bacterium]